MFSSCALPECGTASATNVNKLTDFQYASLFSIMYQSSFDIPVAPPKRVEDRLFAPTKEAHRGGPDVRGPWPIISTLANILPSFKPPDDRGATIPVWGSFRDGGTVTASLRGLQPDFGTFLKKLPSGYEIIGARVNA